MGNLRLRSCGKRLLFQHGEGLPVINQENNDHDEVGKAMIALKTSLVLTIGRV